MKNIGLNYLQTSFVAFEETHNLYNWRYKKHFFWTKIRTKVFLYIVQQLHNIKLSERFDSPIFNYIKHLPKSVFHSPCFNLKQTDFLIFGNGRRIFNSFYYEDIYFDSWLKNIDASNLYIEYSWNGTHLYPVQTKNRLYFDIFEAFALASYLIRKPLIKLPIELLSKIDFIQNELERLFSVTLPKNFLKNELLVRITVDEIYYRAFRYILLKTKPKFIIEVCYYSNPNMILNEVAHSLNIPTYELQHGTIGSNHVAYNFKSIHNFNWFPDNILLYGDYWRDSASFPISKSNTHSIGNPYLEQLLSEYPKIESDKKYIIIISQPTIIDELIKFVLKLHTLLSAPYEIIYKLHPQEYSTYATSYKTLIEKGVHIAQPDENLYYLQSKAYAQVGVYSTAVFEGFAYGLRTFIIKAYGSEYMLDAIEKGFAHLVETPEQVIDKLNTTIAPPKPDYFWKNDAKNNMVNFINNLLK